MLKHGEACIFGMLYNLRHALAVNVEGSLGPVEVGDLACNLLWPYVLALKLQLGGIHRSRKEFTRPSRKASENRTFILKVFLLNVCVSSRLNSSNGIL